MPDLLGVTAGVVGITAVAIHTIHVLIRDIDGIKDAPEAIANIKNDLNTVEGVLVTLQNVLEDQEALSPELKAQVGGSNIEAAVLSCDEACKHFQTLLVHWMRHSTADKISKRDRLTVGYFKKEMVTAFTQQLATCKATVSLGVDTANFLNGYRQRRDTAAMMKLLQAQETRINTESALVVSRVDDELSALERLSISDNTSEEDAQDRVELMEQLKQSREMLEIYKTTYTAAVSEVHYKRTGIKLKNIRVSNKGKAMVGVINVEGVDQIADLDIQDVIADGGGKLVAGVAKVNTDNFWDD